MIRLSKLQPSDITVLVFDVRPKSIALELGREPKVFMGRITPNHDETEFAWESRWGGNQGRLPTLEAAQQMIEKCARGQYK